MSPYKFIVIAGDMKTSSPGFAEVLQSALVTQTTELDRQGYEPCALLADGHIWVWKR